MHRLQGLGKMFQLL